MIFILSERHHRISKSMRNFNCHKTYFLRGILNIKKIFSIVLTLSTLVLLCACSYESDTNIMDSSITPNTNEKNYLGNYEDEPVYQKIIEIENCTNPDQLCRQQKT